MAIAGSVVICGLITYSRTKNVLNSNMQLTSEQTLESALNSLQTYEKTISLPEELQSEQQKAIERTEEVFRQIIARIEQMNAGMENINRLNADMSSNKDTVVSRMEAIASVSEQSAAATEEVNASADQVNTTMADIADYTKTLQNIAQDLEQTIEKFRLMEI